MKERNYEKNFILLFNKTMKIKKIKYLKVFFIDYITKIWPQGKDLKFKIEFCITIFLIYSNTLEYFKNSSL